MTDKYIVVTAIAHTRVRFVIPKDAMDEDDYLSQAVLLVENDEVNEFSQVLLTMDVVDSVTMNTDQVLKLYTDEVDSTASNYDGIAEYLADWYLDEEFEVIET